MRKWASVVGQSHFGHTRGRQYVLLHVCLVVARASIIGDQAAEDEEAKVGVLVAIIGLVCEWDCGNDLGNGLCWCHCLEKDFGISVGTPASLVLQEILHGDGRYTRIVLALSVDYGH